MGSSKKKIQLWKKALFHFSLCFFMGFFTGLAPRNTASIISNFAASNQTFEIQGFSPEPAESFPASGGDDDLSLNRSLMSEKPSESPSISDSSEKDSDPKPIPTTQRLLIVITPTRSNQHRPFQVALLRRLGNTLKLVPAPLLWIVVQSQSDSSSETTEVLRKTGIMYRHLIYKENFTDHRAEINYQRNTALNLIEHHRLNGIVHFAGVFNVYDLQFFQSIREIEVFGTWPMAMLAASRKKVLVEGPVCTSSQVMGWHLRNGTSDLNGRFPIHISSFAFNSSILWDPERWGRVSSVQDNSQNSIEFVQQVVVEDETKLKGITEDCSKIMLWHLRMGPPNHSRR